MSNFSVKDDFKSSIVVFLVALPLCLGIALASGAPLISGIVAGVVGGIVIGFLSDSPVSVSGPAAGLTVIVSAGIIQHQGFSNFGIVVMLAGFIQLVLGLIKAGGHADLFPQATIRGMLAAIGLTLIIKQAPVALGKNQWSEIFNGVDLGIVTVSVISMAIILGWEPLAKKFGGALKIIPGQLIAVLVGVILNIKFQFVDSKNLVNVPHDIIGAFKFPDFHYFNSNVILTAFTIAIVASIETLLCTDAADAMLASRKKTNKNRELVAQGVGNFVSGLLGGLPLTAVIVRTSTNIAAGGKSKFSSIFHGFWLLGCVLLIPGLLNKIPLATLSCILLVVGYKLTKPALYLDMAKRDAGQFTAFMVTIVAILTTDLLKGIMIGLVLAFILEIKKFSGVLFEAKVEGKTMVITFKKDISFFHKRSIMKALEDQEIEKVIFQNFNGVKKHIDIKETIDLYAKDNLNLEIVS